MNSPMEKTEPVAYRWRFDLDQTWSYGEKRPSNMRFGDPDFIEPVYPASTVEALKAERDAAFAMSKCECGPDEACANLVSLNAQLEALKAENAALLSRVERDPFDIVADWHDKQAVTFKEMARDSRSGQLGQLKAAEAAKHHAGSAAALRLHRLNQRRAALQEKKP